MVGTYYLWTRDGSFILTSPTVMLCVFFPCSTHVHDGWSAASWDERSAASWDERSAASWDERSAASWDEPGDHDAAGSARMVDAR